MKSLRSAQLERFLYAAKSLSLLCKLTIMLDHIKKQQEEQRARISGVYIATTQIQKSATVDPELDLANSKEEKKLDEVEINKSEGSRGGKVIGHTKSGKPIYEDAKHESHKDFSVADHNDAIDAHGSVRENYHHNSRSTDKDKEDNDYAFEQQKHHIGVKNGLLAKSEDTDLGRTLTPSEHRELIKSQIANTFGGERVNEEDLTKSANDYFQKGGKAAAMGEKREFGGKPYIKTSNGWRPVGKNGGKYKDAHETVHGKDKDAAIHQNAKEIASASGIKDKEYKDLHPDTKKELLDNMKEAPKEEANDNQKYATDPTVELKKVTDEINKRIEMYRTEDSKRKPIQATLVSRNKYDKKLYEQKQRLEKLISSI